MYCFCVLSYYLLYFYIIIGYPIYQIYLLNKKNKYKTTWILYFLIIFALSNIGNKLLYPLSRDSNKIAYKIFTILKSIFAIWLYHPKTQGINAINNKFEKYIDKVYSKIPSFIEKIFSKLGF